MRGVSRRIAISPKKSPGPSVTTALGVAVGLPDDVDLALDHDHELLRRRALASDHLSGVDLDPMEAACDQAHLLQAGGR